jgi:uncharacterized protein (DUF1800 family)
MAASSRKTPSAARTNRALSRQRARQLSDLLVAVAQDPAMLIWLDGDTNTKARPQENFGRELMELFTRGVGFYTEDDVYAAAKVFTGWNLNYPADPATDPARSLHLPRTSTTPAPRRSRFRSTTTAIGRFRTRRGVGHAGRPRSDQRACHTS